MPDDRSPVAPVKNQSARSTCAARDEAERAGEQVRSTREIVLEERRSQGLPDMIRDPDTLRAIAAAVGGV